jgi:ABC-type multidrug transport system permease subunit
MRKLVQKDLKLFFGNKRDMLLTFALPIVIITLFSFVFGKMGNTDEDNLMGIIHVVAGTSVMMLLFSVSGIGESLLEEKQEGMLKKLLCSPMHPNNILFGKIIFAIIISISQLSIMFVYSWLVFGLDILHHIPSLVLMIIVTAYACSSFGILLASFAKSRKQVQALSTAIIMIMSGIGGSMIPIFVMPEIMQKIAVFSVNYWGIQGFYDIFWRLLPITDLTFLSRVLVLIGIGTALNFIAFLMFKKNILKIV